MFSELAIIRRATVAVVAGRRLLPTNMDRHWMDMLRLCGDALLRALSLRTEEFFKNNASEAGKYTIIKQKKNKQRRPTFFSRWKN